MLALCLFLGPFLHSSALDVSSSGYAEAVMASNGALSRSEALTNKKFIMRRGDMERSSPASGSVYVAPHWKKDASMPTMPTCTQDVDDNTGVSDYGRLKHACTECAKGCTETNKQQPINATWLFEPKLEDCNAHDLTMFVNWSNVENLHCDGCNTIGIAHKIQASIASNAGDSVPAPTPAEKPVLAFEAWFGPEITGHTGPKGEHVGFPGKHVFEVYDTVLPSKSEDCGAVLPEGRWVAMDADAIGGESFTCTRIDTKPGTTDAYPCGRTRGLRCQADMAMESGQLFKYRMYRETADGASTTTNFADPVGSAETARSGIEWVVAVEDITPGTPSPGLMVVGRIILEGLTTSYGIKHMKQSHSHIGCFECDKLYASAIVTGPFIAKPVGTHAIRSADGVPPSSTTNQCGLWRMTAMGEGPTLMFETGPGLWPTESMGQTLFSCSSSAGATCPV